MSKQNLTALLVVVVGGLLCGWARGSVYMYKLVEYEQLYNKKVTVLVRAGEDAVYGKTKQLSFSGKDVTLEGGQKLMGHIQLSGFGSNAVFQDDEVVVTGKLRPGYGIYQASISFGEVHVVARHPSLITELRRKFVAGTETALPEPLAPFVMGLLVGQRANLPQATKNDLQRVGLTHIIAVSGANLTIILQAMRRLFGKRSKRLSTMLTLGLMFVFLLIAGASASIVRAAMVSTLSIFAAYYGRSFHPLSLITMAAAITAWANPVYIWNDLGWWLSFLAFFGVMVLAPLLQARWSKSLVGGVALESLCAEVMSLPFILFIFGQMSRVGLLANVLVVSLIPIAMLLGLISGLAGMLIPTLAGWFAWPAVIVLNYMLDVAHILSNLPHIFIEGIGLNLLQMLVIYSCIIGLVTALWFKKHPKSAIITDMNEPKMRNLVA